VFHSIAGDTIRLSSPLYAHRGRKSRGKGGFCGKNAPETGRKSEQNGENFAEGRLCNRKFTEKVKLSLAKSPPEAVYYKGSVLTSLAERPATTDSGARRCWERMGFVSQTTKRALEASLKKLLLQKPLNKITINDITEDCGVNRMTFYYHFKDIYDLVDWIMVEDAAKALEEKPTFDTWSEAYLDLLRQVQENKVLVMNVYRSMSREQVEQYLYRILDPMLREFLDRGMQGITVQDADKQFIVDFYKYALVGMTLEWIRRDMKEDPVRMTERLNILLHGEFQRALRRFRTDRSPSDLDD